MSIKTKLIGAILVPIAVSIYFIFNYMNTNAAKKEAYSKIIVLSEVAPKISDLVHELQKERGMSAGYLSSGGKKFTEELPNQQKKVDAKLNIVKDHLSKYDIKNVSVEFNEFKNKNFALLDELQNSFRKKIIDKKVSVSEEVAFITKINTGLIDSIALISKISVDSYISDEIYSYVYFLQSKERAGIERAVLTSTFEGGIFTIDSFSKFNRLVTEQNVYLEGFKKLSSPDLMKIFESRYSDPSIKAVQDARDHAYDVNVSGAAFIYKSQDFFKTITKKIEVLKDIEDNIGAEINKHVSKELAKASSVLTVLYVTIVGCLAVMVLAILVNIDVVKRILSIAQVAKRFKNGEDEARVTKLSNDELGVLGTAMNEAFDVSVKSQKEAQAEKQIAEEAQVKAEKLAREAELAQEEAEAMAVKAEEAQAEAEAMAAKANSALEGSSTAFVTCDRDFRITYINPSTVDLMTRESKNFTSQFKGFNVNALVSSSIDVFLDSPAEIKAKLSNPNNLPYQKEMKVGELDILLNFSAMKDSNGNYVGNTIEWEDITQKKVDSAKAASLQSMVENVETSLMICNLDRIITYVNPSIEDLLSKYEAKIREKFPVFSANNLVGKCIDEFHKNVDHQASLISDQSHFPYKAEIEVNGLEFELNAMALKNADGEFVGVAVEWIDNNDRAVYRNEVASVIEAAKTGDLSKRGKVDEMSDVYKPMLQGINDIIDAIVEPIDELKEKLEEVASGDLTAYVTGNYHGDHEKLKISLNSTLDNLNNIMNQVNSAAQQMAQGTNQVSDSSQSISQGATEQAASLEQITASMNEMSNQTTQNAENANQANKLAMEAQEGAESGNEMMNNMLKAMGDIDNSAQKISNIIKVIDEIAFQTNLLALNAAVEAARAGVHGKGFAVVAEEVRNLAARSANAAKETTELIEGSIKNVNVGTEVANNTSTSLKEIVGGISKVTDLVGEIAASSNEQALGINQVNQGLVQLDQVTQQNTANAEESAAASLELSEQSVHLTEILKQFKLKSMESPLKLSSLSPEMLSKIQGLSKVGSSINANEIIPLDDLELS